MRVFFISLVLILIFGALYYFMPFEVKRQKDIKFGKRLIERLDKFKKLNNGFPNSDNMEVLKELGFKIEMFGTNPTYSKISKNEFEIIYLEGFDGPYLKYNSKDQNWSIGFPKL